MPVETMPDDFDAVPEACEWRGCGRLVPLEEVHGFYACAECVPDVREANATLHQQMAEATRCEGEA